MTKKMEKLRINRKRWIRGDTGSYNSRFYHPSSLYTGRSNDRACCLGHAMHFMCGIPWDKLRGVPGPDDLPTDNLSNPKFAKFVEPIKLYNAELSLTTSSFTNAAVEINDNNFISDEVREKELIHLFRQNGIKLEFYN